MQAPPVTLKLPDPHCREIGRIIATWAQIEWRLKQLTYSVMDIGQKAGRIAVREQPAKNYPGMLKDLLSIKKIRLITPPNKQMTF
jgi:hypothetical protein